MVDLVDLGAFKTPHGGGRLVQKNTGLNKPVRGRIKQTFINAVTHGERLYINIFPAVLFV